MRCSHSGQDFRAARVFWPRAGHPARAGSFALQIMQEQADDEHGATPNTSRYARFGSGYREFQALEVSGVTVPDRLRTIWQRIRSVAREEERFEPPGFVGTLRPYQRRGLAWLWYLHQIGLGACLADDMGLGKTIQAIALFLEQERTPSPEGRRPRLLICPTSVLRNWKRELQRFAPDLRVVLPTAAGGPPADGTCTQRAGRENGCGLTATARRRVDQAGAGRAIHGYPWMRTRPEHQRSVRQADHGRAQPALRSRFALTGTPTETGCWRLWRHPGFPERELFLGFPTRFKLSLHSAHRRRVGNGEKLGQLQRIVQPCSPLGCCKS